MWSNFLYILPALHAFAYLIVLICLLHSCLNAIVAINVCAGFCLIGHANLSRSTNPAPMVLIDLMLIQLYTLS